MCLYQDMKYMIRIAHAQGSDGWIETTWSNLSDPGPFAVAEAEEQEGATCRPIPAPVWSPA
jgi:hypothetical protein